MLASIGSAVVVVPGNGNISPLTQCAGLSLLKRAVLTAQRAGATTCYLCIDHPSASLQQELHGDPRVTTSVIWVECNGGGVQVGAQGTTGPWLVFCIDAVFLHSLAQEMAIQAAPDESLTVTNGAGAPVLAVIPPSRGPEILAELVQGRPLAEVLMRRKNTRVAAPPGHYVGALSSQSSVAAVEHDLLRALENPRGGGFDSYFNRKLSRPITRWLLRTPLSPNQVTAISFSIGVLGALCFLPGGYWWPLCGALLAQCAAVIDCCDGEVARAKFLQSRRGYWLDVVSDTVVHILLFVCMGIAIWRNGETDHALTLAGVLALGGIIAFPLVTLAEETEEMGGHGWEDVWITGLLRLATRDFSVLILLGALMGKLHWFLWGAAIGAHVFWVSLAWLLFRARRFRWVRRIWEKKDP